MPAITKGSNDELRILTPVGCLGFGYNHSFFWSGIEQGADAIILDSGSTDSGPTKLALGKTSASKDAYRLDLEPMVEAAQKHGIPTLIGSAGGAGSNDQVDLLAEIVGEIVRDRGFRSMKVVKIYSEIDKDLVRREHDAGLIRPCGGAVPDLKTVDIDDAVRVVAQMGLEPYVEAMNECPDFDIIIGGRAFDPAPYAAFCLHRGFNDLGIAYHMGKVLECGAQCAVPKGREILAVVRHDNFDLIPLDPIARCTAVSVAAHALYEKTRPDILEGPGGSLHLENATFEELPDGRSARVRGARFEPVRDGEYTVKLEAARRTGYHSTFFGGITDPVMISQIDLILKGVKEYAKSRCHFPHELKFTTYGNGSNISMFAFETQQTHLPASIAVLGQAKAGTQDQANQVINAARVGCVHAPYPGQVATAGNFAMPSFDIPLGAYCEFCIYHLMTIKDPITPFPRVIETIKGQDILSNSEKGLKPKRSEARPLQEKGINGTHSHQVPALSPLAKLDHVYLGEFASVIRSKNAGPYELTFDIVFDSRAKFDQIKSLGVFTESKLAKLYEIDEKDIVAAVWWPQAMAFKFTVRRPIVSGNFGETDTHGSCQHVRLMYLQIPGW